MTITASPHYQDIVLFSHQVFFRTVTSSVPPSLNSSFCNSSGTQARSNHPQSVPHCPHLQITLWGSLARACASLLAMSSDRYLTPAPKETRTKPLSWAPLTHACRSCGKQSSHWTLQGQSTATLSKHGLARAVLGALSEAKFHKSRTF